MTLLKCKIFCGDTVKILQAEINHWLKEVRLKYTDVEYILQSESNGFVKISIFYTEES